jgi:hypothetical protein
MVVGTIPARNAAFTVVSLGARLLRALLLFVSAQDPDNTVMASAVRPAIAIEIVTSGRVKPRV